MVSLVSVGCVGFMALYSWFVQVTVINRGTTMVANVYVHRRRLFRLVVVVGTVASMVRALNVMVSM